MLLLRGRVFVRYLDRKRCGAPDFPVDYLVDISLLGDRKTVALFAEEWRQEYAAFCRRRLPLCRDNSPFFIDACCVKVSFRSLSQSFAQFTAVSRLLLTGGDVCALDPLARAISEKCHGGPLAVKVRLQLAVYRHSRFLKSRMYRCAISALIDRTLSFIIPPWPVRTKQLICRT